MLLVLAAVRLRDSLSVTSELQHELVPGDLVLVVSGPSELPGHDWYEVSHRGAGGWLPAADDDKAYLALDAPDPSAEVWDLVAFGDSSSVPADMYALRIEERFGVEVRARGFCCDGAAAGVLSMIKTDDEIRALVAGAELITIEMNPGMTTVGDAVGEVCLGGDPTPRDPPQVYSVDDYAEYADLWRQVYDEIFALRAGQPTVVRATDMYVPVLDAWKAAGIEPECTADWEAMSDTVKLVAAEYGVPMASSYDLFNGPNHDQDPVDRGWFWEDDIHPNEQGRAVQVGIIDELGYAPLR